MKNLALLTTFVLGAGSFLPDLRAVTLTEETYLDIPHFKIVTRSAAYYYDKPGAGFSGLFDKDGKDWITWRSTGGSAGHYRGIPNMGLNVFGHPGYTGATSTSDDPRGEDLPMVTIRSTKGNWEVEWEISEACAKMTIKKVAENYWILYEGTPGGAIGGDDRWYKSDGTSGAWTQRFNGDITNTSGAAVGTEWIYFADGTLNRSLFMMHEDDDVVDDYWPMENNMTVFGFARGCGGITRCTKRTPAHFLFGLMETREYGAAKAHLDSVYKASMGITAVAEMPPRYAKEAGSPGPAPLPGRGGEYHRNFFNLSGRIEPTTSGSMAAGVRLPFSAANGDVHGLTGTMPDRAHDRQPGPEHEKE